MHCLIFLTVYMYQQQKRLLMKRELTAGPDMALGGYLTSQSNYWVEPPISDACQNPSNQSVCTK